MIPIKSQDFFIGVGGFIGLNVAVYFLSMIATMLLMIPAMKYESDFSMILFVLGLFIQYVLPLLINIAALIYFALARTWIAIGMLGTFGFLMGLVLILGVILSLVCFATGGFGA